MIQKKINGDLIEKVEVFEDPTQEKDLHNYFGCEKIKYLDLDLLFEALPDYHNKCTMCLNPDPNLEW